MGDKDEAIINLCGITGMDPEFASELLAANDWDHQKALNAFFGESERNNSSTNANTTTTTTATTTHATNTSSLGTGGGVGGSTSDDKMDIDDSNTYTKNTNNNNNINNDDIQNPFSEASLKMYADALGVDVETAKAIREAELGSASSFRANSSTTTNTSSAFGGATGNETSNFVDESDPDYVRAPIKPTITRLVSGGAGSNPYRSGYGYEDAQMMSQFGQSLYDAVKILQQNVDIPNQNQMGGGSGIGGAPSSSNEIYARFSPGRDIVFQGTLEVARGIGKKNGKRILVNIQDETDFQSLNLNRDVWRDEIITSLIKDSFIFFQREKSQADAEKFIKTYKIDGNLPFVGIIDPKTGALLVKLKVKGKENELRDMILEQLSIFLENQDATTLPPMKSMASTDSQKSGSSSSMVSASPSPPPASTSSIAAPIASSSSSSIAAPPVSSSPSPFKAQSTTATASVAAPSTPSAVVPAVDFPPEPDSKDPNAASLQFINFNGQKFQRRFLKNQKVEDLFSFISTKAEGKEFDLMMTFPNKSLKDMKSQTIEESGLLKIAIRCKFV